MESHLNWGDGGHQGKIKKKKSTVIQLTYFHLNKIIRKSQVLWVIQYVNSNKTDKIKVEL